MLRMHADARPGAIRTEFCFNLLREAYSFIEEPSRSQPMFREIGHDELLCKYEDNGVATLSCYFISNTEGDAAGTGIAACYSGVAISKKLECYVQPPIPLSGWKVTAFLDMCESTAEFLHRTKFYYNNKEYPTQVMLTLVKLEADKLLSVDSDFVTRESREGDHCYTILSKNSVLGSTRPEDIVNGPKLSGELGDSWLELYLMSKLAWRLDMLGLEVEYNLADSCRAISVFLHFVPVFLRFAINQKMTAFAGNGFNLSGEVNGSEISIRNLGERGERLDIKNRVMSMGFSAVLAMWCSWLSNDTTRFSRRLTQAKLHEELITLGDMKDLNVRTKYDDIEACLSLLLSVAYPNVECYKERVLLYGDLLVRDKLKRSITDVYKVKIPTDLCENEDPALEEDTEYDHFAGATQGLALFNGSIAGETCVPKKGWSPQSLCQTRKMFWEGGVIYRVTVVDGQLRSNRGLGLFFSAIKCVTGVTILGNGFTMNYQERHCHTSQDAIVNALLCGSFGAGPAKWMLHILSEGLIKVDRANSNCIAECATDFGIDGVKIRVPLPPKVANELSYVTDGMRVLTMVSVSAKAVEVSTTAATGRYSWDALRGVDVTGMEQFRIVHRSATG